MKDQPSLSRIPAHIHATMLQDNMIRDWQPIGRTFNTQCELKNPCMNISDVGSK